MAEEREERAGTEDLSGWERRTTIDEPRLSELVELYEELELKLPEDVEIKKRKAYVFTELDEMGEAISTYEEVIDLAPEDCTVYVAFAELHTGEAERAGAGTPEHASHIEEAIGAYTKITELCPEETAAYNKLGEIYFDAVRGDTPKYRHWCTPVYG